MPYTYLTMDVPTAAGPMARYVNFFLIGSFLITHPLNANFLFNTVLVTHLQHWQPRLIPGVCRVFSNTIRD